MKKQNYISFNVSSNFNSMENRLLFRKRIVKLFFCLLLIVKSQSSLFAQNILDNAGLNDSTPASVAYSMRKLSTSYSGYALQVRRSSDNTTQNIGFTAEGDLDTVALATFVGANSGYVSIWYDQSGNGLNLTQTTLAEQPRIVNAGTIDLENNKPFIRFFKTTVNWLKLASEMTTTGHVAVVNKFASGGAGFILGHTSTYYWHANPPNFLFSSANTSFSVYNAKVWQNGTFISPASAVWNTSLMVNSIAPQTANSGTNWDNIGKDRIYNHTSLGSGYAELIVFSSAINTRSRINLEKNQGAYYSISIADNYLNKYGQVSSTSSDYVNRNGAIGISAIVKNGESISQTALLSPVTAAISSITSSNATSGVSISSDAGGTLTAGVCWNTSTNPTINNFKTTDTGTAGSFSSNLTNLTGSTTYYVRGYATNGLGTVYGSELSFITLAPVIPTLAATNAVTAITGITATSGGNVITDGGTTIMTRGVCWSTVSNPTIADNKITDAGTTGSFVSNLTGLSLGTLYYVRAYATNSLGTEYGTEVSFTTLSLPTLAATVGVSSITSVAATSGSEVTWDGGAQVTARGVCWSTSTAPTVALSTKTTDGTGMGSYASSLTALAGSTTYYVRAYATNSVGTTYGTEVSFTTLAPVLPTLAATTDPSSIYSASAVTGGNVISDGGATITTGVCWSTTTNPTIANSNTAAAGVLGVFSSTITGLNLGTTYYVRAYATNSVGTVYGTEVSFTTRATLAIGDLYQGGILGYFFVSGDTGYVVGETHGLIITANFVSTGIRWNNGTNINIATSTALGTGSANTTAIIAAQGNGSYAASLCRAVTDGGYSDWYLPSKNELDKIQINRASLGSEFSIYYYWSSSQSTSTNSWRQNFAGTATGSGTQSSASKSNLNRIRAVRNF